MLTASQKILTQDVFAYIIRQTLCSTYKHTSMKAHYLVLRSFDNYADLWARIEHFIARSLPALNKYRLINSLLIYDLVYYYLVPQFLSLSRYEVTEVCTLHAIYRISRQRDFKYYVEDHFLDYTQVDIACPRHVCQLQEVGKVIDDLEFKVEAQRQGSEMAEWRIVLRDSLLALEKCSQPICDYLSKVLERFVDTFIIDNRYYSYNYLVLDAYAALRSKSLKVSRQYADVRNAIEQGNLKLWDLYQQIRRYEEVVYQAEMKASVCESLHSSLFRTEQKADNQRARRESGNVNFEARNCGQTLSNRELGNAQSKRLQGEKDRQACAKHADTDDERAVTQHGMSLHFYYDYDFYNGIADESSSTDVSAEYISELYLGQEQADMRPSSSESEQSPETPVSKRKRKVLKGSLSIDLHAASEVAPEAISTAIAIAYRDKNDDLLITDDETESRKVLKPLRTTSDSDYNEEVQYHAYDVRNSAHLDTISKNVLHILPPTTPVVYHEDSHQQYQSLNSPSLIHGQKSNFVDEKSEDYCEYDEA